MGADMLIAAAAAPLLYGDVDESTPLTPDAWKTALAVARKRLEAFDFSSWELDDFTEFSFFEDPSWDDPDWFLAAMPPSESSALTDEQRQRCVTRFIHNLMEQLESALIVDEDNMLRGRRDLTSREFEGRIYWLTGGLSWGESPTDSFDLLNALDELQVFNEPIEMPSD